MPKKRTTPAKSESDIKEPSMQGRWWWAGVYILLGVLLIVAMADYSPEQSSLHTTHPTEKNAIGIFGVIVSQTLFMSLGFAGWLVPVFLVIIAWLFERKDRRNKWLMLLIIVACIIAGSGLLSIQETLFTDRTLYHNGPGGAVGHLLYNSFMELYLGHIGSAIILGAIYLGSLVFIIMPNTAGIFEKATDSYAKWRETRAQNAAERNEAKLLAKQAALEEKERLKLEKEEAKNILKTEKEQLKALKKQKPERPKKLKKPNQDPIEEPEPIAEPETVAEPEPKKKLPPLSEALKIVAPEETKKARIKLPESQGDYTFPKLDLLEQPEKPNQSDSESEHAENAERLKKTLKEFGVDVTMGEIHIGPVITRYEVYPAPGVRVEKISSLDKNIALGMRAQSVRILAPVPGKGCVGIEVPNMVPAPVGIREILESEDWANSKAVIPIALGRDVSGKPIISDLTRMPHLLIAGATGAGKTVCINAIITSLLYHSSPENLRFIMVDPKIVEMKIFNSLPHMLIPVVTDPKKVPGALKWLLNEMEHRYELFAKHGVRNIAGFNGRKKPEKEKTEEEKIEAEQAEFEIKVPRDAGVLEEEVPDKLPYIVCIVDELADLMMVAPADIETGIARLAQLARAAGIHLVLATQRPSVNVITGVIKANLPCRISFQVSSKIDSRTILDSGGAEQLIGRGDMLFSPPGSSALVRSQGAFVSDEEISDIVEFLKDNGPPIFAEDVQKQIEAPDDLELGGGGDGDGDELFPKALDVLRSTKRASTSMLQRRLRIGYNRAARLMEELEDRGIVGPENGSSPREILVDLDSY
ncbi:DNA translocase FtsK [Puniceicoccaceae bacterium K14]|nr:DNA translocase FtsK [Puniceicoccaceae bacterium K14]